MEKKKSPIIPLIIGIAIVVIVVAVILMNSGKTKKEKKYRVIKVDSFAGTVGLLRDSEDEKVFKGMKLMTKDKMTTGAESTLELLADSDKHILAEENTCFSIIATGSEKKGKMTIDLEYGTSLIEIDNKLNDGSEFEVHTPNAITAVRGTTFEVTYDKDKKMTIVTVTKGTVEVSSDKESRMVEAVRTVYVLEDGTITDSLDGALNGGGTTGADGDMWELPDCTDEVVLHFGAVNNNKGYDVGVKRLVDWEMTMSSPDICDGFSKEDVFIEYKSVDQKEFEYIMSDADINPEAYIIDTVMNADGDEVYYIEYVNLPDKTPLLVHYFKKFGDQNYICVAVMGRNEDDMINIDIEQYADLTCNRYFEIVDPQKQGHKFEGGINEGDFPNLLRGNATMAQLRFLLSIMQACNLNGNQNYTEKALYEIYYDQDQKELYKPIRIDNGGYVFDINEMNTLFSVMTDEKISESNIPRYATISGNELIYQACDVSAGGYVSISIKNCTKLDTGEIIIDYSFRMTRGSDGEHGINGTSKAHLTADADGKYKIDSIEIITEEEF